MSDQKKINIVFVLTTCEIGGTERQFLEMVRRLDQKQFAPRILVFSTEGKLYTELQELQIPVTSLDYPGIRGRYYPDSYIRLYTLLRKMVRYFRQENPHIVQSYLFWANVYGGVAAKIAGVPYIITQRRGFLEERYCKKRYTRWLLALVNRWTSLIVTNSRIVKHHCLQTEQFVTEEKILVIYNGIDLTRYALDGDHRQKKRMLSIPDEALVVGVIANLIPYKGHYDLLQAAALVLQTYPEAYFLLVGRDNHGIQPELEHLAEELHIRKSVIFTGERDDIPEILTILDVQVSSSLTESLSNAILEGMAAGKPIVATDVGGNSELVVHEETGLLVPSGHPDALAAAIVRLLGSRELRHRYGRAGRTRVATLFPMERMVAQTETLYRQIVLGNGDFPDMIA